MRSNQLFIVMLMLVKLTLAAVHQGFFVSYAAGPAPGFTVHYDNPWLPPKPPPKAGLPVIEMRTATWCGNCPAIKQAIRQSGLFDLHEVSAENDALVPSFSWQTPQGRVSYTGWYGLEHLQREYERTTGLAVRPPSRAPPRGAAQSQHGGNLYQQTFPAGGVGLQGHAAAELRTVSGGKASALAIGKDTTTGWPLLSALDIIGQLTIDVPCVIERCRITNSSSVGMKGGWYTVNNTSQTDFVLRDCEINGPLGSDQETVSAAVLYPRTMQRCVISGGIDGVKIGTKGGCLIEDCVIYGQLTTYDAQGRISHNDGIQITGGTIGDWDTWIFRRCRIEGDVKGPHDALMFQAENTGNVSGITLEDCFFSGGPATVQLRQFSPYALSKVKITGCMWANNSWTSQPLATSITPDVWQDNYLADVVNLSIHEPITVLKTYPFAVPKLIPTTSK